MNYQNLIPISITVGPDGKIGSVICVDKTDPEKRVELTMNQLLEVQDRMGLVHALTGEYPEG